MEVRTSVCYNSVCKWETFNWGKNTLYYIDEDFLSKATQKGWGRGSAEVDQTRAGRI